MANEDEEEPGGFKTFLGPGDHLFATVCSALKATIAAASSMATELAEKALHSTPVKKADLIPHYFHDFEEVFAKESFDSLPEKCSWDHAIELEPGSKPSTCKVYPLTPKNKCNWTVSCKRISHGSDPPFKVHLCFSLRRKMVHLAWFRTTVHSMP